MPAASHHGDWRGAGFALGRVPFGRFTTPVPVASILVSSRSRKRFGGTHDRCNQTEQRGLCMSEEIAFQTPDAGIPPAADVAPAPGQLKALSARYRLDDAVLRLLEWGYCVNVDDILYAAAETGEYNIYVSLPVPFYIGGKDNIIWNSPTKAFPTGFDFLIVPREVLYSLLYTQEPAPLKNAFLLEPNQKGGMDMRKYNARHPNDCDGKPYPIIVTYDLFVEGAALVAIAQDISKTTEPERKLCEKSYEEAPHLLAPADIDSALTEIEERIGGLRQAIAQAAANQPAWSDHPILWLSRYLEAAAADINNCQQMAELLSEVNADDAAGGDK